MEVSMLRYAAGRIVLTVPVLFGVSLMSFASSI
jgi:peptide/nickel transport system permease protein